MDLKNFYKQYIKRVMDILCSFLFLVLFWWLLVLVAFLVKIRLGSPILFTQDRPGKKGKVFKLYKFRSMIDKCDKEGNPLPDDERLPKFGRILRSTSLDELPEIFNILKGDMSVVGPRPLLVEYLPYYTKEELRRHEQRPGLTGWAQINGRNATGWDERLQQDVYYVDHCSLFLDCKIILRTVLKVVKRSDVLVGKQIPAGRLDVSRKNRLDLNGCKMKFGNVNIRPFTENDILNKVRWINDCENNKFLHYELPLDEDKTRAWFHKNKDRADRYDAIIEYDRNPVGVIGLLSIVDGPGRILYYVRRKSV